MDIAAMNNKIIVAGIGPGNPDYMVPMARQVIAEAKVLVGGRRALGQFAQPAGGGQQIMAVTSDIPAVLDFISRQLAAQDVVVMVSGDPGYYSLLDAIRRTFPAKNISVIPGISAIQLAFARLALPWHDARLVSFHGRRPEAEAVRYTAGAVLGVLTDAQCNSQTIPAILMEHGWPETATVHICARLSYEDESIETTTLSQAQHIPAVGHGILVVEG